MQRRKREREKKRNKTSCRVIFTQNAKNRVKRSGKKKTRSSYYGNNDPKEVKKTH